MQDLWLSQKADEIQTFADSNNVRCFYDTLNTVYGPRSSGSSPALNADGTKLLTDRKQILERWAEHFSSVLNRPSSINNDAIDLLPQVKTSYTLDDLPIEHEVEKAIHQLSCGKAPGSDSIPAEVFRVGGQALIRRLTQLYQLMWKEEQLPQQFKDATVVHIYKRKGNRQSCDNHRGISNLSISGKIFARILLNRLLSHLEQDLLPESQCGFRAGCGTVDMVFATRQLQEKCQEQCWDLYTAFMDLLKGFDTVSRDGLRKIMKKYGCPRKVITLVQQFHNGMMVRVLDDGEEFETFPVKNGVKQGCVLAPTLFSMMFSTMLTDAFHDSQDGIKIKYRTDNKLFNIRRMQTATKVRENRIRDLLFADDCALNATNEHTMQPKMNPFPQRATTLGLL